MANLDAFLKWVVLPWFILSFPYLKILSQSCDRHDLLALKEFAGNLASGTIKSAWANDSACCQWVGVFCDDLKMGSTSSSRVTRLILPQKDLNGMISPSLGRLDQLKLLDLSFNLLKGELPVELSNLRQLEVLDLSHNLLIGSVSPLLTGMNSVRSINISSNSFEGNLFSVWRLYPRLSVLDVSNNSFTGQIHSQICSSNEIQIVDLSMNQFIGGLDGISNCTSFLKEIHLDFNSLSGHLPDSLFSISSLEQLSISGNNFSGNLSEKLSKLSSLKSLVIYANRFSGLLPNVFGNLTQLEKLIAHSNSFLGPLPSSLSMCSKLRVLDFRNNSLSGFISLNFTGLPSLYTLDLASNRFSGGIPISISNSQKLEVLSLAKNELTGEITHDFANLKSLLFLSLSNNSFVNLSGALSVLQKCKNLTTLILTENFHGEEIPKTVIVFENLMVLALGNCALTGHIPIWLLNCRNLQVLDLSWNRLNGNIPAWIGQMENLFYLDFSNNSLTGEIPKSLMELKRLISLNCNSSNSTNTAGIPLYVKRNQSANGLKYNQASSFPPSILLSNNRISGKICPEIGKLKQLHVLDLSKNNITGTIPDSICEMRNLEVLDLSSNNLYGSMPASFNKLTFLSKFSVAFNHLSGAIPTGGQFLSFPCSSFEGNPGLVWAFDSNCRILDNVGLKHKKPSNENPKFGRNGILVITISVGMGIAFLLAILLLKTSKSVKLEIPITDLDEEIGGTNRVAESLSSSKLVLFQNSICKDISVGDLIKSTNNFNQANIIGCGGFGLVYKANFPNGLKAAVKRLSGDSGQMEREFQAEVEALSRAQHKNLVSLQGYCRHFADRLLIYSYMENGSLDYWLHEKIDGGSSLNWDHRLKVARGSSHGLAYLHKVCEPNIVHRDIKSSNILLDENFEAHLADFGLSRLIRPYDTHVTTDLVGTLGYIPPEYSQTLVATFKGDVYSFGVVMLELLTGRRPVEVCKGKNCRDLVSWVIQMKSEKRELEIIDSAIWEKGREKEFLDVLSVAIKCIDQDPRRRPPIEQVVMWLDSVGTESTQT